MKSWCLAGSAVLAIITLSCGKAAEQQAAPPAGPDRDLVQLQQRVKTLETDLLGAQKALITEQSEREDLRRRLAAIEGRFEGASMLSSSPRQIEAPAPSYRPPDLPAPRASSSGLAPSVVSATYRITESNNSWSRFAYIIQVRAEITGQATIEVQFKDSSGFVVDTDTVYKAQLHAGINHVADDDLIDAKSVSKVTSISASIR